MSNFASSFLGKIFQRIKPIDVKGKSPLFDTELAIDESAIYKRMKLVPYTPDALVSRKKIDIFNEMMADPEIESAINTLKTIRLSSGWEIKSASDDAFDKELQEFVEMNFENIEGSFDDDLREIMGAVEMGISINELIWGQIEKGRWAGKIYLKSLKSKNPKYFNIYVDDFDNIRENGVVNISSLDYGHEYPVEKFVIYSFNKRYENVFGTSRIRTLYDLWFIKKVITRSLGIYLEKFGHPFPVLKHPPLDETTKNNLLTALRQIRVETGLMIPRELELELIADTGRGSDVHLSALRYINEQIRKVILGQTLTTETTGKGSYSLGQIHFDILMFYIQEIGLDVSVKAINNQIIKRLIDYNYEDVQEYPKFQFKPLIQKDIEKIIDKYYQGVERGIIKPIPEDEIWLREQMDLPKRDVEEQPSQVVQQQLGTTEQSYIEFQEKVFTGVTRRKFTIYEETTDFAETRSAHEDAVAKYTPKISSVVQEGMQDLIKQIIKNRILEDKNFEAIKNLVFSNTGKIKEIFKDMLINTFENSMKQAKQEILNKKRKAKRFTEVIKFQWEIDLRKITPQEALAYFESKSFDMAGIERNYIIEKVKTVLYNAIKTGSTIRDTTEAIQKELAPYFEQGLVGLDALRGYRIETVIRTNVNEAFNEGRKAFFESPELEGYVQAYQYSAILDDRVRPNHARMDGRIYSITSPVWDMWTPPNGFNCRCVLIPITQDEEWEESPMPPASLVPDAGFEKPGH